MIRVRTQYTVLCLLLLVSVAAFFGCSDDNGDPVGTGGGSGNAPVGIPTAADNVSLSPTLHWHPVGDWGDSVVYDLYFGSSATPSVTFADLSDTSYAPGPLEPSTTYRWAVRAKVNGTATGWSTVHSFGSRTSITYPVALGNRWEYRWSNIWVGMEEENQSGYYVVEITRAETGWPVNPVWAFEETWYNFDADTLAHATTYYHVTTDGLYLAGYDGAGDIHPISGDGSYRLRVNDQEYNALGDMLISSGRTHPIASLSPEDIIIETPPKLVLEYPIAVGAAWTFRLDDPWRIDKSIDDYEIINVPAGRFGCFVVHQDQDVDGDGVYDGNLIFKDYVAEQGLVRRTHTKLNVMVQSPDSTDWRFVDIIDTWELVAWE